MLKISRMKWKYRLPLSCGAIFFLMSLPFILGYPGSSIHENAYSLFYILVNYIALSVVVISGIPQAIDKLLSRGESNLYLANVATMALIMLFYLLFGFFIGRAIDSKNSRRKSSPG